MKNRNSSFRAATAFIAAALSAVAPISSGGGAARVQGAHEVTAPQGSSAARNAVQTQAGQSSGVNLAGLPTYGGTGYGAGVGYPPKDWGMSQACARMVRKNALIRRGISAQKI